MIEVKVNVRAAECSGSYQTMSTNTSAEPRADVIVRKYRTIWCFAVSQME